MLAPDQFVHEFIKRNRNLTWAEELDPWRDAEKDMLEFLDEVQETINSGTVDTIWSPSASAKLFSILITLMAEAGQYRHETLQPPPEELLKGMGELRVRAAEIATSYLGRPVFESLSEYLNPEIFPLIKQMTAFEDLDRDRLMPFRVVHAANIVERIYGFRFRTSDPRLNGDESSPGLLQEIYNQKYLRFGTSGVRGRWGRDFTELRAKQVVQAVCDFLKADESINPYARLETSLHGRRMVIGYDSRLNARLVASWAAQVCLANGFKVDLAYRDTPTPALVYYLIDYLDKNEVAGLINCTASHNPPEWQGIKFNPRLGYPAPTSMTDSIAARINEIQLSDQVMADFDLHDAEETGQLRGFDPINIYTQWIMDNGNGNQRIKIDFARIRAFFGDKLVVVDEMHGAGRGYMTRLLGECGVRHTVIHGETDPRLPGLEYANPEEPFIEPLKKKVEESGAVLGLAMDTDADRFGVVDNGGVYLRPNQILPMLIRYLGIDRGLKGRIIATQTGSPLIEPLAGKISDNEANEPESGVIPAYIDHPLYKRRRGKREDNLFQHTFMVPVGIKYIEEQRRTNRRYQASSEANLPDGWRDVILIGGEESSGLTTRGHVTDKDGIWANLLVMDMMAYYGTRSANPLTSLYDIWEDTCNNLEGTWMSYGGRERENSHSGRTDVDAILEAKEDLINYYLDLFADDNEKLTDEFKVVYAGGIRYDAVELRLADDSGDDRHFLRIRSSGTEPINRVYVESSDKDKAPLLMQTVLDKLEELIIREINTAQSEWRMVEVLSMTRTSPQILKSVNDALERRKWSREDITGKLKRFVDDRTFLEGRNRRMVHSWLEALK